MYMQTFELVHLNILQYEEKKVINERDISVTYREQKLEADLFDESILNLLMKTSQANSRKSKEGASKDKRSDKAVVEISFKHLQHTVHVSYYYLKLEHICTMNVK